MRLTSLERAAGAVLARDIASPEAGQMPILRAGAVLTEGYVTSLEQIGVSSVWIQDELSEGIEPHELVPPQVRQETARKVSGALTQAQSALVGGHGMSGTAAQELKSVVRRLLECVADSPSTALVLNDLAAADAHTFQHSIDTCALGLLIGRTLFQRRGWQDFRGEFRRDDIEGRLLKLGLGLILHDAGKLGLPTDEAALREHPAAGAELLNSPAFSPLVRAVVREHHENWDGSGYPRGLAGTKINELARIGAVANAYDIMTSEQPDSPAQPAAAGRAAIAAGSGTMYDPEVVEVFMKLVVPYPVGSEVTLPDGRVGVVTDVPPDKPDCPVVRLPSKGGGWTDEPVDLAA
jgi:HD-GYP domain-containing protein (c-di-GMP phosphodiesterase class II)